MVVVDGYMVQEYDNDCDGWIGRKEMDEGICFYGLIETGRVTLGL